MTTITIRDEVLGRGVVHTFDLDVLTEHITVRDLIRSRVYQEVQDHNVRQPASFRMLVEPEGAERELGDTLRLREPRRIEWQPQFERAIEAFARGQVLVLIDDRQRTELDEVVTIRATTCVTFLRLLPLVGG